MPELPAPPEDYDDQQRQAWLEGAATVARLLGQQNAIIAGKYEDQTGDRDDEDETCPECGGELVEAFGGAVCGDCGAHHESD